ncbi:hypothetical protein [Bradyrhizobium sp. Cp5.3]|uniref:hypothetical protein n=1 Tax=Bradyrhizobium sp. Cp5.3 TaxID=443598 RepID=UPI000485CB29|nr:hypothetical protein [Bradyrhizobium sp. Cp5.3]
MVPLKAVARRVGRIGSDDAERGKGEQDDQEKTMHGILPIALVTFVFASRLDGVLIKIKFHGL